MTRRPGKFGKQKQNPILCVANLFMKDKWRTVCGISTGDLYVFEDRDCVNNISSAHSGGVVCIQEVCKKMILCARSNRFIFMYETRDPSIVNFW